MILQHADLKQYTHTIFAAAGCSEQEAARVAEHLVEANLVGHDSHGIIRIARYIEWIQEGKVLANQQVKVILENDMLAVLDGQFGLGQSIGEQAVRIGLDKCSAQGISIVGLRDAGHLGRIGDWPLMAARENKISIHFVNTSGAGILVAPFGGVDRRLSANPFAVGVPRQNGEPIILDISACMMAEGKIRVALHQGKLLPDGCIIDAQGQPANDPKAF
ncbi:MAG: Ldh family oxidoreductase, partial [Pirellulaceae bacterium]